MSIGLRKLPIVLKLHITTPTQKKNKYATKSCNCLLSVFHWLPLLIINISINESEKEKYGKKITLIALNLLNSFKLKKRFKLSYISSNYPTYIGNYHISYVRYRLSYRGSNYRICTIIIVRLGTLLTQSLSLFKTVTVASRALGEWRHTSRH